MLPDAVLQVLPAAYHPVSPDAVTLLTGGSDRHFYRVRTGGRSWIILHDTALENEFARYTAVQERLARAGVGVPECHFVDMREQVAVLEDLGGTSLEQVTAGGTAPGTADAYRQVLDFLIRFQHAVPVPQDDPVIGDRSFDTTMLRWETWYFRTHYLGVFKGISPQRTACLVPVFARLADMAGQALRVLLHRDFQAQNVYITGGQVRIIDFQAVQPGPAGYDAASLLYDPYAELPSALRTELLGRYRRATGPGLTDEVMAATALQRLLQALGAYGYLACVKQKRHYLEYVPAALKRVREVLGTVPGVFDELYPFLTD